MATNPTYEELEQRVKELENEAFDRKRMEEALRESEEKHRLFFENCPIGIIHYTSEGTVTEVNDAMIAIFGSSRDKLVGLNIDDIPDKRLSEAVSNH